MTKTARKKLGFYSIALELDGTDEFDLDCEPDDDESTFIRGYHANLLGYPSPRRSKEPTKLGYVHGQVLFGASALNSQVSIVTYADDRCADLGGVAQAVYGDGGLHEQDQSCSYNTLYIAGLFLEPQYRGLGLGQRTIMRFIEIMDPGNLCAIVIIPNAESMLAERKDDPLFGRPKKAAQARLERYYRGMGFQRAAKGSVHWYMFGDSFNYGWRRKLKAA